MSESEFKLSAIQKQLDYWRAYGMDNDPFDDESVEGRFFWGEEREELLTKALQLACCATQAVVFFGPHGIGKTKLRQALEERLEDDEQIVVVSLQAGRMTMPQQVLAQLGRAFELQADELEPAEIEVQIKERLQADENVQNKLVILVDDADQLPEFTLASLLVMATYPDNYISVLLFAATDSNGVLRAELQNQQIQQCEITPFDTFTLESYLRYRFDLVGGDRNFLFTAADIDDLLLRSGGIPRRVDELAQKKLRAALQPQVSLPKANHAALLPALKAPQFKLPTIKFKKFTLPRLRLPQIQLPWQPLAAVAGLLLFLGGAWLFSGGSANEPAKAAIASAPATTRPVPKIEAEPKPKSKPKQEPAAQVFKADQQWIDQALAMAPAAGKPVAGLTIALAATALPPSLATQSGEAQSAGTTAKESLPPTAAVDAVNESSKPQPASEAAEVKLTAVKVNQKYLDKARAALPRDEMYLLKSPQGSYTLQLLGSSSKTGMRAFIKDNKNVEILVFEEELEGRPWFVAVTGSYESVEQARDGLAELPTTLRELKPWPRQFSSVQEDIRRYRLR